MKLAGRTNTPVTWPATRSSTMEHKDRALILGGIGVLLLLIGIPVALLGPIEMYCFYLFSEGGRFH